VLWAAGVLASPAGRWINSATDKSGRIIVNSDLSVPGHPEIFAIGDTAHVVAHSRNLLGIKSNEPMLMPGVAQPAIQEGRYVARLIGNRVAGTKPPKPVLVLGQGRPGYRGTYLCRCRPALPAIFRIPRLACVGGGPHLFPHWVR
jgi:NADH dehydrogenase